MTENVMLHVRTQFNNFSMSNKKGNLAEFSHKTEPVTAGADATVYVWFLSQNCVCEQKPDIRVYRVIRSCRYTGSVFMRTFRFFLKNLLTCLKL